jgi:hypothetical protein
MPAQEMRRLAESRLEELRAQGRAFLPDALRLIRDAAATGAKSVYLRLADRRITRAGVEALRAELRRLGFSTEYEDPQGLARWWGGFLWWTFTEVRVGWDK